MKSLPDCYNHNPPERFILSPTNKNLTEALARRGHFQDDHLKCRFEIHVSFIINFMFVIAIMIKAILMSLSKAGTKT